LVASSQPTGSQARPGQEVGRRARALSWWRWARDPRRTPRRDRVKQRRRGGSWLWLQVLGGSRAGARRLLGWRIHGGGWEDGWMMGGQQAPTEPKRVNSEVSSGGQASNNNYQTVFGCKDTMKHFLMAGRGTIFGSI